MRKSGKLDYAIIRQRFGPGDGSSLRGKVKIQTLPGRI
jgi:hypothetical protein